VICGLVRLRRGFEPIQGQADLAEIKKGRFLGTSPAERKLG